MNDDLRVREAARRDRMLAALGGVMVAGGLAMFLGHTLVFAACVGLILVLTVAVGASKRGTLGPFRGYLAAALLVWLVAFAGMHWLPATTDHLVLGFPPATAMAIFGLWLVPFFVVTLPYALHFDSFVLTDEDWARLAPHVRRDEDSS